MPLGMAVLGLGASLSLAALPEGWIDAALGDLDWSKNDAGLRTTLSVVATSVMSVVSIVFSLTFVAMSLTAQQLSPRMLDFVLRERIVQAMIGLALATFLFSTGSLTLGHADDLRRLGIASWISLGLATLTVLVVVGFVHRMTAIMRPDEMIARRGESLNLALADGFNRAKAGQRQQPPKTGRFVELRLAKAGYVGVVDAPTLVEFAKTNETVVKIDLAQGAFLLADEVLVTLIDPPADLDLDASRDSIAHLLCVSDRPEVAAGAIYEARGLAEGAIRALSPGVNDPGTALSCINRLAEAADRIIAAGDAPNAYADGEGTVRLFHQALDIPVFVERALLPVAQNATNDAEVAGHLARLMLKLADRASGKNVDALHDVARLLTAPE